MFQDWLVGWFVRCWFALLAWLVWFRLCVVLVRSSEYRITHKTVFPGHELADRSEMLAKAQAPIGVPSCTNLSPNPLPLLPAPCLQYIYQLPHAHFHRLLPINGPLEWSSGFGRRANGWNANRKRPGVRLPPREAQSLQKRIFVTDHLCMSGALVGLVGELFVFPSHSTKHLKTVQDATRGVH